MKLGKHVTLKEHNNVKIKYGTVDYINLESIYIELCAWIEPTCGSNYAEIINKSAKAIKRRVREMINDYFKNDSIVDIDIKTNNIKQGKKSFMKVEITLFVKRQFNIRTKEFKWYIYNICKDIIDNDLNNKDFYIFYLKK